MSIETIQIIIGIATFIVLTGVSLYLVFFKSYFSEKGKNLATTEDIRKITQTVEEIKTELDYSKLSKLSLESETRDSLIEYYVKFSVWINTVLTLDVGMLSEPYPTYSVGLENQVAHAQTELNNAYGKMELFTSDAEILKINAKLVEKTVNLNSSNTHSIGELRKKHIDIDFLKEHGDPKDKVEKIRELYAEIVSEFRQLGVNRLERYKKLRPIQMELRDRVYQLIAGPPPVTE